MFEISRKAWREWAMTSAIIAVIRIAIFAFLEHRKRTGTESLSHLPLVLLLLPEGLLFTKTLSTFLKVALLTFGSGALSAIAVSLSTLVRRRTD